MHPTVDHRVRKQYFLNRWPDKRRLLREPIHGVVFKENRKSELACCWAHGWGGWIAAARLWLSGSKHRGGTTSSFNSSAAAAHKQIQLIPIESSSSSEQAITASATSLQEQQQSTAPSPEWTAVGVQPQLNCWAWLVAGLNLALARRAAEHTARTHTNTQIHACAYVKRARASKEIIGKREQNKPNYLRWPAHQPTHIYMPCVSLC